MSVTTTRPHTPSDVLKTILQFVPLPHMEKIITSHRELPSHSVWTREVWIWCIKDSLEKYTYQTFKLKDQEKFDKCMKEKYFVNGLTKDDMYNLAIEAHHMDYLKAETDLLNEIFKNGKIKGMLSKKHYNNLFRMFRGNIDDLFSNIEGEVDYSTLWYMIGMDSLDNFKKVYQRYKPTQKELNELLYEAVQLTSLEKVKYLISIGADPNSDPRTLLDNSITLEWRFRPHLANFKLFKFLFEKINPSPELTPNKTYYHTYMTASKVGNSDIVKYLLTDRKYNPSDNSWLGWRPNNLDYSNK